MFPLTNLLRNLASHPGYSFKQIMASVATAILTSFAATVMKGTLGLLDMKARRYVADNLRDGDVVEQKLCSLIVTKLESIKLKLDTGAQSVLKASFSSLKEGFIFLNTVLDKDQSGDDSTETSDEGSEAGRSLLSDSNTLAAYLRCNTSFLTEEMKNLEISNLADSQKRALIEAKKRFDEARFRAIEAFNNNALTILDRVLALNVHLSATILARVENPACVLPVCRNYLEELHAMPEVEKNFLVAVTKNVMDKICKEERGQIISAVCQINRLVYDVTKMVDDRKLLLLWPYIKVNDEKIDPLRDSRVARTLRKQNMDHCCLTWSFGQQGDKEQRSLKSATGIATNSLGHFLVIDKVDGSIKVFDTTGRFLSSFSVPQEHDVGEPKLKSLATDGNDNVYVLQVTKMPGVRETFINQIFVFDKSAKLLHKFVCGRHCVKANIVRVMHDHSLLVIGVYMMSLTPSRRFNYLDYLVYISKMRDESGTYRATMGDPTEIAISNLVDILIISDSQTMMPGSDCVYLMRDSRSSFQLKKYGTHEQLQLISKVNSCVIAYHHISEQIIIVSHSEEPKIPSVVSIYNKDGKFDRSIHFEVEKNYRIKGVSVTRDGLICISAHSKVSPIGKVIVL